MEVGGRKGGGRCDEERLCARRDFPLARRASAYKRLADWLPRRPRCLVRYRPGSGRHRLPSGPASREEEAGRIRGLSRAFSRLLRPGMGVALKGRERVVVVFRSSPLNLHGHPKLCDAGSSFSSRHVCTCVRSAAFEKHGGRISTRFTFIADQVHVCMVASRTKVQNPGL